MKKRGMIMVPELQLRTANLELMGVGRRTDKRHVSQVLREMKKQAGEKVTGIEGETEGYRPQLGFLFETALELAWKKYWFVELDEINWQMSLDYGDLLGTPDGLDTRNHRLISVKLTWKSARKWEEDFQTHFRWWMAQEMAYAKMMFGQGLVDEPIYESMFIVGFTMGDYKGPWRLGVYTDIITFTEAEIEDNWQALQSYKAWMEGQESA